MEEKIATLNAVLSFFIPGIGQFMNGQMQKGAIFLLIAIILGLLSGGIIYLLMMIFCAFDAYKCAIMINNGEEPPFLPF